MTLTNDSAARLRDYVRRVETVKAEIKDRQDDVRMILNQAKGDGFDVKALRQVLRLRKMSKEEQQETEYLIETYMRAVDPQLALELEPAS